MKRPIGCTAAAIRAVPVGESGARAAHVLRRRHGPRDDLRDRVFDEQAGCYPVLAGYADKTAGVRTIPVLALRQVRLAGPSRVALSTKTHGHGAVRAHGRRQCALGSVP
jgi:hypothetical protein